MKGVTRVCNMTPSATLQRRGLREQLVYLEKC
jgi:hypothetical protein